jgi:heme/copper-type cytochrome/quinol oxidase subunit 4
VTTLHLYIGWSIVIGFIVLAVYGLVARLAKRDEVGRPFWGLLYYTETVLVIQIVVGLILLFMGRRVGTGFDLHYFYGSLFPLIAVIVGRLYTIRRENDERAYPYVPIALAAFVAFGLTSQALMTGLGWR